MSILYTASHPERVSSLIVYGASPRFSSSEGFLSDRREFFARVRQASESICEHRGEGSSLELFAPSAAGNSAMREDFGLFERAAASPAMANALFEAWWEIDVGDVLPVISVPALVLHRSGDLVLPVDAGRYLAEHIPGVRFVELPGEDHLPQLGETDLLLDEVEQFLTGARESRVTDRVLATVLFTDIVGSTERASQLGDRRWRELLEAHAMSVRSRVQAHHGRIVKSLGDGHLATFDGPARALRCGLTLAEDAESLGLALRVACTQASASCSATISPG